MLAAITNMRVFSKSLRVSPISPLIISAEIQRQTCSRYLSSPIPPTSTLMLPSTLCPTSNPLPSSPVKNECFSSKAAFCCAAISAAVGSATGTGSGSAAPASSDWSASRPALGSTSVRPWRKASSSSIWGILGAPIKAPSGSSPVAA